MIREEARVLKADEQWLTVDIVRTSSCSSCHADNACGTASISRYFNFRSPQLKVRNAINAKQGDLIVLAMQDSFMLKGSMLLYLAPLICMMLAAVMADLLFNPEKSSELLTVVAGLTGLIMGLLLARKLSNGMIDQSTVIAESIIQTHSRPVTFV